MSQRNSVPGEPFRPVRKKVTRKKAVVKKVVRKVARRKKQTLADAKDEIAALKMLYDRRLPALSNLISERIGTLSNNLSTLDDALSNAVYGLGAEIDLRLMDLTDQEEDDPCCEKMGEAESGTMPHVVQRGRKGWALDGQPFQFCPWCGRRRPQ